MFKKIQDYLLLRHPLLWNTRIVVFASIAIAFHVIFFLAGYLQGEINFQELTSDYRYSTAEGTTIFFSVLVSIFSLIIWFVFYARNNGFKAFYPKQKLSLFKEWSIIFLIFLLNVTYSLTFLYARDFRARNYFSYEELQRRLEIISQASVFMDGSYDESEIQYIYKDDKSYRVKRDSFLFDGRRYSLKSLVNKNTVQFDIYDHEKDSLLKREVRLWLKNDNRDSVKKMMTNFMEIAKSHHLKGNISVEEWFKLTYKAPEFTDYKLIGKKRFRDPYYSNEYSNYYGESPVADEVAVAVDSAVAHDEAQNIDVAIDTSTTVNYEEVAMAINTSSERIVIFEDRKQIESKYYLPMDPLLNNYSKVVRAWDRPDLDWDFTITMFYVALFLSLATFSFRVTSGRNWLIALIVFGVTNFVIGLFSIIGSSEEVYLLLGSLIIFCLIIYFISIVRNKKSKEISGVTLNITLWTLPAIVPILYAYTSKIVREASGYNDYIQTNDVVKSFPSVEFIDANWFTMFALNIIVVALIILIMSNLIKKWKGVAED